MMGSGKSTIGKILSKKFNIEFLDTDLIIEQQENKTCKEIFSEYGERFFRSKELKLIAYLQTKKAIIATGGGFPVYHNNMDKLLKMGSTIYLKTAPEEIYNRISNQENRPLLQGLESLKKTLEKREYIYKKAHKTLITDGKSVSQIIEELIQAIG